MNYNCKDCNKTFISNIDLERHQDRKFKCNVDNTKCSKCKKQLFNVASASRHETICKGINKNKKDILIEKLKKENEELKKHTGNTIQTANNIQNNNIQNNNNINVTLLPYNKTSYFLSKEDEKKLINTGYLSVSNLIQLLHFNKDHPENHNVCISNDRSSNMLCYEEDKWKLCNKETMLQRLYEDKQSMLLETYDKIKHELESSIINKFRRAKTDMENNDKETIEMNLKNIKLLCYNERDIVLKTKKLLDNKVKQIETAEYVKQVDKNTYDIYTEYLYLQTFWNKLEKRMDDVRFRMDKSECMFL